MAKRHFAQSNGRGVNLALFDGSCAANAIKVRQVDGGGNLRPVQVGLVGYLSGDVKGSFAAAAGALDLNTLQKNYFNNLTLAHSLNLAQFGTYGM